MALISTREAAGLLGQLGLSWSASQHLLATGIAGHPVRTGASNLYDSERVGALLSRPALTAGDLQEIFPAGCLVGRVPRGTVVDVTAGWQAAATVMAGPWPLEWRHEMGIDLRQRRDEPLGMLLTVSGVVTASGSVTGVRHVDGTDRARLDLRPPGPWASDVRGRLLALGRGRALTWVCGWTGVGPRRLRATAAGNARDARVAPVDEANGAGRLVGPVEVVGTGLIGTSIALACRRAGLEVLLSDADPDHVRTASGLGAGRPRRPEDVPQLVVVAVPPDHLGGTILQALDLAGPDTVVTDVGSVKEGPLQAVQSHPNAARYVGSHPMAGTERSGPLTASPTLFDGRPWAVTATGANTASAVQLVESLVQVCGGVVVRLEPVEHDRAVARTSHVPHLMSALVAGTLAGAAPNHLALSGQGIRDVTRVAGGDARLYTQIIGGNAKAVADLLGEVRSRLDLAIEAVQAGDREGLASLLLQGNVGTQAIPGKHGGPLRPMTAVRVTVPDHPGELKRLFMDAGDSGVNIEDVRIDHDPGREYGLVEIDVESSQAEELIGALQARGWETQR
ncbi:prephenate dehydrogenase [Nocardioides montaniterrae]